MSDESKETPSKLFPYNSKKKSYIREHDLEKEAPPSPETFHSKNAEIFKNIYAHYSKKKTSSQYEKFPNLTLEVNSEMENAKLTYDMMMEISKSIADAYNDLKKQN